MTFKIEIIVFYNTIINNYEQKYLDLIDLNLFTVAYLQCSTTRTVAGTNLNASSHRHDSS